MVRPKPQTTTSEAARTTAAPSIAMSITSSDITLRMIGAQSEREIRANLLKEANRCRVLAEEAKQELITQTTAAAYLDSLLETGFVVKDDLINNIGNNTAAFEKAVLTGKQQLRQAPPIPKPSPELDRSFADRASMSSSAVSKKRSFEQVRRGAADSVQDASPENFRSTALKRRSALSQVSEHRSQIIQEPIDLETWSSSVVHESVPNIKEKPAAREVNSSSDEDDDYEEAQDNSDLESTSAHGLGAGQGRDHGGTSSKRQQSVNKYRDSGARQKRDIGKRIEKAKQDILGGRAVKPYKPKGDNIYASAQESKDVLDLLVVLSETVGTDTTVLNKFRAAVTKKPLVADEKELLLQVDELLVDLDPEYVPCTEAGQKKRDNKEKRRKHKT